MGKLIRLGATALSMIGILGDDSLCAGGDFICEAVHTEESRKKLS